MRITKKGVKKAKGLLLNDFCKGEKTYFYFKDKSRKIVPVRDKNKNLAAKEKLNLIF